ncbi:hypothetical protein BCD48_33960 [Pseudofrankia sp. BMG5.36]|nr:hypothetical protein BCD48_33960 [Pseudofrankia sp. BMG5.36]
MTEAGLEDFPPWVGAREGCAVVIGAVVIFGLLMAIPPLIVFPPIIYYYRKSAPLRAQAELDRTRRARELAGH